MGRFIIYVLLLISFYNLAIKSVTSLFNYPHTEMYATTTVILVFTLSLSIMIKQMGYSFSRYGINLNHWQRSLAESIVSNSLIYPGCDCFKMGPSKHSLSKECWPYY